MSQGHRASGNSLRQGDRFLFNGEKTCESKIGGLLDPKPFSGKRAMTDSIVVTIE